jgi:hypothetical protein
MVVVGSQLPAPFIETGFPKILLFRQEKVLALNLIGNIQLVEF